MWPGVHATFFHERPCGRCCDVSPAQILVRGVRARYWWLWSLRGDFAQIASIAKILEQAKQRISQSSPGNIPYISPIANTCSSKSRPSTEHKPVNQLTQLIRVSGNYPFVTSIWEHSKRNKRLLIKKEDTHRGSHIIKFWGDETPSKSIVCTAPIRP